MRLKVLALECLGRSSHDQPSPSRGHRLLSINSGMAERAYYENEDARSPLSFRKFKDFRSSVPGTGGKDQVCISFHITISGRVSGN